MKATSKTDPGYGTSAHYQGSQGETYFLSQSQTGRLAARWNLNFWREYIQPEDRILEFGCGGGFLLSVLPGKIKVGVEINPAARNSVESFGITVYPTIEDVEEQTFTKVISSHALEHVPAPLTALKQLRNRLAKEGSLLLVLPLDDWRTPAHRIYRAGEMHHHLYAWTPQNLGNLLGEAGFVNISVRIITDAMPPRLKLAELVLRNFVLRKWSGKFFSLVLRRRQLFTQAKL